VEELWEKLTHCSELVHWITMSMVSVGKLTEVPAQLLNLHAIQEWYRSPRDLQHQRPHHSVQEIGERGQQQLHSRPHRPQHCAGAAALRQQLSPHHRLVPPPSSLGHCQPALSPQPADSEPEPTSFVIVHNEHKETSCAIAGTAAFYM